MSVFLFGRISFCFNNGVLFLFLSLLICDTGTPVRPVCFVFCTGGFVLFCFPFISLFIFIFFSLTVQVLEIREASHRSVRKLSQGMLGSSSQLRSTIKRRLSMFSRDRVSTL